MQSPSKCSPIILLQVANYPGYNLPHSQHKVVLYLLKKSDETSHPLIGEDIWKSGFMTATGQQEINYLLKCYGCRITREPIQQCSSFWGWSGEHPPANPVVQGCWVYSLQAESSLQSCSICPTRIGNLAVWASGRGEQGCAIRFPVAMQLPGPLPFVCLSLGSLLPLQAKFSPWGILRSRSIPGHKINLTPKV